MSRRRAAAQRFPYRRKPAYLPIFLVAGLFCHVREGPPTIRSEHPATTRALPIARLSGSLLADDTPLGTPPGGIFLPPPQEGRHQAYMPLLSQDHGRAAGAAYCDPRTQQAPGVEEMGTAL